MEEQLQKRNTDCVYFLASPLTCKKGLECEFRHSEIARLNPRDCWYWLAGSCLNQTCAFRHPPLESHAETPSESAPPHHKAAVPVNKTNVPCYFYFNGYCNKGERCTFLHGPDDGTVTWKSSKIASGDPDGLAAQKKTSAGSETGPPATENHTKSSETGSKAAAQECIKSKAELHFGARSASPVTSGSPSEEATAFGLGSSVPDVGFTQGGSHLSPDQSSDEEVDNNVEREEWLESSPGFDVLVDDDRVDGEDDHTYLLHHDMEDNELDERYAGYDFENNHEYDPRYPDVRIVSDEELDESYRINVENQDNTRYAGEILISAHGRLSVPRKRKLPRELDFCGRGNLDLRDFLNKARVIESEPTNQVPRRIGLSRLNAREQRKDRHRPQGSRCTPRRLASKVESNASLSCIKDDALLNGANRLERSRKPQGRSNNRQHLNNRRRAWSRAFANEASRGMNKSTEVPEIFSGPKTLAQIKEDKRNGASGGSEREDFLGPKPLSEILKDKKKTGFSGD